jgi:hypothetical protein
MVPELVTVALAKVKSVVLNLGRAFISASSSSTSARRRALRRPMVSARNAW